MLRGAEKILTSCHTGQLASPVDLLRLAFSVIFVSREVERPEAKKFEISFCRHDIERKRRKPSEVF